MEDLDCNAVDYTIALDRKDFNTPLAKSDRAEDYLY
jgi:hypothetical protein